MAAHGQVPAPLTTLSARACHIADARNERLEDVETTSRHDGSSTLGACLWLYRIGRSHNQEPYTNHRGFRRFQPRVPITREARSDGGGFKRKRVSNVHNDTGACVWPYWKFRLMIGAVDRTVSGVSPVPVLPDAEAQIGTFSFIPSIELANIEYWMEFWYPSS